MRRYVTILVMLCCIVTEVSAAEDKHPEMPFFEQAMDGNFLATRLESVAMYFNESEDYLFFLNSQLGELYIYSKQDGERIRTISDVSATYALDENGQFFFVVRHQESPMGYEVKPPYQTLNRLETLDFASIYHTDLNLLDHTIAQVECIARMVSIDPYYIFHFKDGHKALVKENHFFYSDDVLFVKSGEFTVRGSELKLQVCKTEYQSGAQAHDVQHTDYTLESLDSVTLKYYFQGSNHFAIGLTREQLFYYRLTLKGRSVEFKAKNPASIVYSLDDHLIRIGQDYYQIAEK